MTTEMKVHVVTLQVCFKYVYFQVHIYICFHICCCYNIMLILYYYNLLLLDIYYY